MTHPGVDGADSMRFVFRLRLLPGHEQAYLDQVDALVDAARSEPALVRYEAFLAAAGPSLVWMETYSASSGFSGHLANPLVAALSESMYPHIEVERVVAYGDPSAALQAEWRQELPALEVAATVVGTRCFGVEGFSTSCDHVAVQIEGATLAASLVEGLVGDGIDAPFDVRLGHIGGRDLILAAVPAHPKASHALAFLDGVEDRARVGGASVVRAELFVDASADLDAGGRAAFYRWVGGFPPPAAAKA